MLDKLTYAGRVETIEDLLAGGRCTLRGRGHRRPGAVSGRRSRAATRSSTSRRSPTSTARSRSRGTSSRPTCTAPTCCSRRPAPPGIERYLQVSTDEVYGSIEDGHVHRAQPARPLLAVFGLEGRRRPDRVRLLPHLRDERDRLPRLEQLRPLPVPREADPAVRAECDARRSAAGVRGRDAGAQLALRDRPLPRDRRRAALRRRRRDLQHRRPGRAAQHRRGAHDHRADGRGRVPDPVREGPPRSRPPVLAQLGEDRGARVEGAGAVHRGHRRNGGVVPQERVVVGADPLRRLPRLLPAPVRPGAALVRCDSSGSRPASRASCSCSPR